MKTSFLTPARMQRGWLIPGGRSRARRFVVLATFALSMLAPQGMTASDHTLPKLSVRENQGIYYVDAEFAVPHPGSAAIATLTDYERIPRFMPGVRTSRVLERENGRVVVEQEAVARFMMFSKRVHMILEVEEATDAIRFRDRCGRSFIRYEGSWGVKERDGDATTITYRLAARPSFSIPEFLLTRLLERDANVMIERLQAEISARSVSTRRLTD